MSVRWQQIRALAAATRARYETELGGCAALPLAVDDLAERVFLLSAFPDPTLDARINGELNPTLGSIRLRPNLDPPRQRFIIAHELGHYVVEGAAAVFQDDDSTIDERTGGDGDTDAGVLRVYNTRERQEQEANVFALELLIPADVLWQLVQQPGWTIEQLASVFAASHDAVRAQLLNVCCLEPLADRPAQQSGTTFMLDSEQQAAVDAPLPSLVVAGPGTGKTHSIVAKYVALVEGGADPASILALTFSNKAAEEMRSRIVRALSRTCPDLAGRVDVSTFHAWGLNFLKSYGTYVGLPLDLQLRATGDLFVLLKRRLADLPLEQYKMLHDPGYYLGYIMAAISRAKDELRTPAEYRALAETEAERLVAAAEAETAGKATKRADDAREKARRNAARLRELAAIYERYEALLCEEGVVDYGDLIVRSIAALRIPEVASEVRSRYQYVLVDEFQDINYAAGQLVALLDGGRGRVWAVGDPWQSIYRFRGASAANLVEFSSTYADATTVTLVRNYRSRQGIIDAGYAIMAADPLAECRSVQQAQRESRARISMLEWEADEQAAEYAAIAHDILRRVGGTRIYAAGCALRRGRYLHRIRTNAALYRIRRVRLGDHAVLCRTHRQVADIVQALEAHSIPVDGGGELLDYPEVKDALAICALARSANSVAMLRALTLPDHKLSSDDLQLLVENAAAERRSLQRATRDDTIVADLSPEGQSALRRVYDLHDELAAESDAWRALTRYLFDLSATMRERIGRAARGDALARRELANLGQLILLARTFVRQGLPGARDPGAFVGYVRLLIEAGEAPKAAALPDGADAVRVMTVHAAKGLEFRAVYVPSLHKDGFPPKKQGSVIPELGGLVHGPLGDEEQEERYLLYVAMTRAQDRLILSRAMRRGDKLLERSTLLPPDAPWPIRRIITRRTCRPPSLGIRLRHAPVQQPMVAASSVDTYNQCPRRYLYQYGYQLFDDQTPFLRTHQSIRDAIARVAELAKEGALPEDEPALQRLLRDIFTRHRLDDVLYGDDYFAQAFSHVHPIWSALRADMASADQFNQRFVVQRPAGPVSVRVDRVEQRAEGVRYLQYKSGRRDDKKDHLSTRIMLYSLVAQSHRPDATPAIYFTATGETRTIEHRKGVLEAHTEKLDGVLAGIAAGRWEPNYAEHCVTCPFNLICPV